MFFLQVLFDLLNQALVSAILPFALWYTFMRRWAPVDADEYACKFTSWVFIVYFYFASYTAARVFLGVDDAAVARYNAQVLRDAAMLTFLAIPVLYYWGYNFAKNQLKMIET